MMKSFVGLAFLAVAISCSEQPSQLGTASSNPRDCWCEDGPHNGSCWPADPSNNIRGKCVCEEYEPGACRYGSGSSCDGLPGYTNVYQVRVYYPTVCNVTGQRVCNAWRRDLDPACPGVCVLDNLTVPLTKCKTPDMCAAATDPTIPSLSDDAFDCLKKECPVIIQSGKPVEIYIDTAAVVDQAANLC